MKAKHAVLCKGNNDAYLAYLKDDGESYGYLPVTLPTSFEGLMEMAVEQPFDHYWIHASTEIVPTPKWAAYDKSAYDVLTTMSEEGRDGRMMSAYGWKLPAGGAKAVRVSFPYISSWAKCSTGPLWGSTAGVKQMLMVIRYIEEALGISIASSPSSTGWNFAKSLHGRELAQVPEKKLASMHFTTEAAFDLVEQRVPHADELRKRFLIKLDKNSAYIASCVSEFYGVGTPVHTRQYDKKAVGVWRVTIHTMADGPLPIVRQKGERWLASPIVRLLHHQGYEVEVHEGYVFLEKHQFLKNWANKVWLARQSLKEDTVRWPHENSRQMAYEAMKQIAVQTIGVTGYGQFHKNEVSEKERPDIKLQTIARTFEVIYHNILKAWQKDGIVPVMFIKDCAYLLVDDIDPHISAPTYMEREGELGGYKREGWMEVTPAVRDILTSNQAPVQKKKALDALGWEN